MRRPDGFTMVEVLAALMIFGLTAVVLGAAYLNVLNSYAVAEQSNASEADIYFARSQLLTQSDLTTAETGAEFDDDKRHIKWTAAIDPANTTDLFTVVFTCVVTDPTAKGPQTYVETFMLLRPTWSDPTAESTLRQNAASRIAVLQGRQQQ